MQKCIKREHRSHEAVFTRGCFLRNIAEMGLHMIRVLSEHIQKDLHKLVDVLEPMSDVIGPIFFTCIHVCTIKPEEEKK